ncbi:hypothetical protein DL95DRAFT_379862, partial [Leptodontidium sp. 2 PMI_412]
MRFLKSQLLVVASAVITQSSLLINASPISDRISTSIVLPPGGISEVPTTALPFTLAHTLTAPSPTLTPSPSSLPSPQQRNYLSKS